MKTCIKCNAKKEDDDFAFRNKVEKKRHTTCKGCHCQYSKTHYNKNRKYYIDKARRFAPKGVENIRQKMIEYLHGKSCVDCHESDPVVLEFDHRNSEEKEYSVSVISRKSWVRTLREIKKCDIRCANCHRRKTARERGWYRYMKSHDNGTVAQMEVGV